MNTNPPKQRYSYVCDCPASVHCKHLDMIGEWLRMGTNRFRYYYDEREGWCEYPKGWFDEDAPQQQSQPMEQSR